MYCSQQYMQLYYYVVFGPIQGVLLYVQGNLVLAKPARTKPRSLKLNTHRVGRDGSLALDLKNEAAGGAFGNRGHIGGGCHLHARLLGGHAAQEESQRAAEQEAGRSAHHCTVGPGRNN